MGGIRREIKNMSGDTPAKIKNIWICPFCGKKTIEVELESQSEVNHTIKYDTGKEVKALVLRIRCEDALNDSVHRECPAMDESGCYFLHIYPDGTCHAYYY